MSRSKHINFRAAYLEFVKMAVEHELTAYQIRPAMRIIKSVWQGEGAEVALLFSRQSGKTESIALAVAFIVFAVILYWLDFPEFHKRFADGIRIGIFSPKSEQAQVDLDRARRALSTQLLRDMGLKVTHDNNSRYEARVDETTKQRVVFVLKAVSASDTSNIESDTFDLIILEEAQDITERKFQAEIEPMGAARNATRAYVGTVGFQRDMFYKTCKRLEARNPENMFDVDYVEVIESGFRAGLYEKYVDSIIAKYGKESEYFRMKFRNEWILERGHPFNDVRFRKICRNDEHWLHSCRELPSGIFLIAGLDVARSVDATVLTIATADFRLVDHDVVLYPEIVVRWAGEWQGEQYDEQFEQMDTHIREHFPILRSEGCISIDTTGDRGSMEERFTKAGYTVVPAVFTSGIATGKSLLCQQFMDQLNTHHFWIAAREDIVGSDFYYDYAIPEGHEIVPITPMFQRMKDEYVSLVREYKGNRLDLSASPGEHDDHPMSGVLVVNAARNLNYVDLSTIASAGKRDTRTFVDELKREGEKIGRAERFDEWQGTI